MYPQRSRRLDFWFTLLSGWFMVGLYLDGWAHNHEPSLETFFTAWHAVLYSGFLALVGLLTVYHYRNVARGFRWTHALPGGYQASIAGILVFFAGAAGDFLWHSIFGVEQSLEALFSPTHLVLAIGAVLFLSGPFRAAWYDTNREQGWKALSTPVLSLLFVLCLLTFLTQFANIMISPTILSNEYDVPSGEFTLVLAAVTGIVSILVPAALTMAVLLLAMRRWMLPVGSLTFILAANNLAMYLMRADDIWRFSPPRYWPMVIAPLAVGVAADMVYMALKPSPERTDALRVFAFGLPFLLYVLVILIVGLVGGLRWEIHMWLGVPFLAGLIGVGLSYLIVPLKAPSV